MLALQIRDIFKSQKDSENRSPTLHLPRVDTSIQAGVQFFLAQLNAGS